MTLSQPLRFGLSLPNRAVLFGTPVELLLKTAEKAEASGYFDSIWVGDNLLSKPRLEAIVLLSAVAARTNTVKLGTICFASFPLRHPIPLAIQWASLDVVSGGRALIAVCIGGAASLGPQFAAEWKAMGMDSSERVERMEEGIELLRRFWNEQSVTHVGKYYSFEAVNVLPKPVQQPTPIYIAVNPPRTASNETEERALRRVARLADGWQSDVTPPEIFGARWQRIREYAAAYNRADQITDSQVHLMVNINDDAAAAKQEALDFFLHYYGTGVIDDYILEHWLAHGSPQAVIDKISTFIDAGCTTPVLRFAAPDQIGQLERCISEVMPAFRDRIGER